MSGKDIGSQAGACVTGYIYEMLAHNKYVFMSNAYGIQSAVSLININSSICVTMMRRRHGRQSSHAGKRRPETGVLILKPHRQDDMTMLKKNFIILHFLLFIFIFLFNFANELIYLLYPGCYS